MSMESLVPTLETCELLKASGWEQQTYGYWWEGVLYASDGIKEPDVIFAPTAQELADQLPEFQIHQSHYPTTTYMAGFDLYHLDPRKKDQAFVAPTLAEALAQLWLKAPDNKGVQPTKHQHRFVIPVESVFVEAVYFVTGAAPIPEHYRVTKLMCECGEEKER